MKALAIAALLCLTASSAHAAKWVEITSDAQASLAFDAEDIEIRGDQRTAWTRTVHTKPVRYGETQGVTRLVARTTFDCKARTFQITRGEMYVSSASEAVPLEPLGPRAVAGGSLGEQFLVAVCAYRTK